LILIEDELTATTEEIGKRADSMEDLNYAIDTADKAVNAIPQDYLDRVGYLSNFGSWLSTRFEQTGSIEDLNHTINIANKAVDATFQDHASRASRLNNLGTFLGTRFDRTGSIEDLNNTLFSYKEGWRCYTSSPSIRIHSAREAANILISQLD
jgi:hypothetical protein